MNSTDGIEQWIEKLKVHTDLRQNLILLKEHIKRIKEEGNHEWDTLLFHISKDMNLFANFLCEEDPKVRKNTAQIIGILKLEEGLAWIMAAYHKESQRFVKPAYLNAIKELNYRDVLEELQEIFAKTEIEQPEENDKKHWLEELRLLSALINRIEGREQRIFCGENIQSECVLLTNRNHKLVTISNLSQIPHREAPAGVMVKTKNIKEVMKTRTFEEILFLIDRVRSCPNHPAKAAEVLLQGGLLEYLDERHTGTGAYYFRLEVKCKDPEMKKAMIKKLSVELEEQSARRFVNSTSDYDFELRLIENTSGNFYVMLKLFTFIDSRFQYRRHSIAASIRPVNAALTMALAKKYLKKDAVVLDPFCGVGTMLIERDKLLPVRQMYGVDLFGEAIEKARINTEFANLNAEYFYIKRDFFEYYQEVRPDEIITDMPFGSGKRNTEELKDLYLRFFQKAELLLKHNGIMVLYTHDRELVRMFGNKRPFHIEEQFEISKVEGTYVYIIRFISQIEIVQEDARE